MDLSGLQNVLILILASQTHCYITRLENCTYSANFTRLVNLKFNGDLIERLQNISQLSDCGLACVTKYNDCMLVNYDTVNETCEIQTNPSRYFPSNKYSTEEGWVSLTTRYDTRQRGRKCEQLDPCNKDQICYDSCNSQGYVCENATNVATKERGLTHTFTKNYDANSWLWRMRDGDWGTYARTAFEKPSWIKVILLKSYYIEYLYTKFETDVESMRIRIGDSSDKIIDNIICNEIGPDLYKIKLVIHCLDGIMKGKFIYFHGFDQTKIKNSVWLYELQVFVQQNNL